jgi:hypothetical protein
MDSGVSGAAATFSLLSAGGPPAWNDEGRSIVVQDALAIAKSNASA